MDSPMYKEPVLDRVLRTLRHFGQMCAGRHVLTSTPGYRAGNLYNFLTFNGAGSLQLLTIFKDCHTCFVGRYLHALHGYGCGMWRRVSTFNRRAMYCDFIFHVFCGGTPSYQMYDDSCGRVLGLNGTSKQKN
nr:uncharacterized protein LOC129388107 [Dermacentor andersoni]